MDKKDVHLFKKLVLLARKQLASIDERLTNPNAGKWNEFIFKLRHARIKNIFIDILGRREALVGDGAIFELINELKEIGENGKDWQDAEEKETDYLRFVLHGIKAAPADDAEEENNPEHEA